MRILIVSQYFPPDITAAAFRMGETAELLRRAGHEVRVITTWPHKSDMKVQNPRPWVERVRLMPAEVGEGGVPRYLAHYLSFVPGSVLKALKLRLKGWKPEVLWVSSPPLFTGLSGRAIRAVTGAPLVFDIRDIWPDTAVAAGQLSPDGRAYRWGRRLERALYRGADRLTCVSRPMKAYLEKESPGTPVSVIYNGVSGDSPGENSYAEPTSQPRETSSPGLEEAPGANTLLYAGNLGHLQGLDVLLEVFARLRKDTNAAARNWRVRLVGGGAEEAALRERVRRLGLDGAVRFEGVHAREETRRMLRAADLLFFSLKDHPVLEKTIPSKLFDYMQAGVPVVGGIKGEGRAILEEAEGNLTFEAGDAGDLAETLETAFQNVKRLKEQARGNPGRVRGRYSREKMTRKLETVFDQSTENRP